jgi:elongation factor G
MGAALGRLAEEDPTFRLRTNEDTAQTVIEGMGELHLEVIVDRLMREFRVDANVGRPQVAYKETITVPVKAEGRHIRQSGGKGQYGHVVVEFEPQERGRGYEFEDKIVGGSVPREYIPSVDAGIREALLTGGEAGFPLVDLKARLVDGSFHEVDSSEMAFKVAGSMAFKQAAEQAKPVLLEPIMTVTVSVPEDSVGDVIGDLNSRRGHPLGMEPKAGMTEIQAEVPMAEIVSYAPDLRAITGGQGDYTMEFARYDEVPAHMAQKVIEQASAEQEAVKA